MTKRELIELLESRTDIPDDAEVRVTRFLDEWGCRRPTDFDFSINEPATRVEYETIGPLRYVEIM